MPRFSASSKKSALALLLASPDFLHHEAGEFSGASHGFNVDSANFVNSQNLIKKINKKSLQKFLLLFAFAKSRIPLNPQNSNPPNKVDSALATIEVMAVWLLYL